LSQNSLRRLAVVHHRQAVQPKPRKWVIKDMSPGVTFLAARWFLAGTQKPSTNA